MSYLNSGHSERLRNTGRCKEGSRFQYCRCSTPIFRWLWGYWLQIRDVAMMIILQALCSTLLQFSVCVLVWHRPTCVMIFLFDSLWNLCFAKDCYQKWPEMLSWLSPCNASGGIFCLKIGCQGTIGTTSFGQEEEAKAGRSVSRDAKIRDKLGGSSWSRGQPPIFVF